LLSLSKGEARNLCDTFKISSIGHLIGKIGETLLRHKPGDIEENVMRCFFNDKQKARDFTKAIGRIAFEKNSAHPAYLEAFLGYERLKKQESPFDALTLVS
jgi:hypothetical protein